MTRETRIAMLVGLLFIIMFGLVISELTGRTGSTAPPKPRPEQAVNQRYGTVIDIEPPPPGDTPGSSVAGQTGHDTPGDTSVAGAPPGGDAGRSGLRVPEHPTDACSEVTVVLRHDAERPTDLAAVHRDPVETIRPDPASDAAAPPPVAPVRKYVVKPKDTLLKIARAEYGPQSEQWVALLRQANKDALKGGDASLKVGAELIIPPLPASAASPAPPATAVAPAHPAAPSYPEALADLRRRLSAGSDTPPAPPAPPSVVGPAAPVPGPTVVDAAKKYYTTRPGDSLAKIAEEVMGDDSRAAVQKLYTANKSKIRDPNKLTVGMKLEIPT